MIATLQQGEKYLWKIETNRSGVKITGGNLKPLEKQVSRRQEMVLKN